MQENRVKRIMNEGGLALGTHTGGIADPQVVEIIGLAGFDAAFIDMEHTSFDLPTVQLMVMAAERVGITSIVRTPGFDPAFILRLLDMGVQGIQVPHVSDPQTAREAVKAVRYPPQGDRGMAAGSRAADFGKTPLLDHMAKSNREILLACMIEDMEAVERIDAIAAVEGVDLLAVGPSDLSRSLGVSGQPDHPRLVAAIDRVREAVKKGAGRPARAPVEPRCLPAQRGAAEGTRRRLFELRADPGNAPTTLDAGAMCRPAEPAGVAEVVRPPGSEGRTTKAGSATSPFRRAALRCWHQEAAGVLRRRGCRSRTCSRASRRSGRRTRRRSGRCPQLSSMKRRTELWSVRLWSTKFVFAKGEITSNGWRGP